MIHSLPRIAVPFLVAWVCLTLQRAETATAADPVVQVDLDSEEVPHLKEWGEQGKTLIEEWYPRICNLIPTKVFKPTTRIGLKIQKSDKGVAYTSRGRIVVSSHWIEKHPEDIGLVLHEMVHAIQAYPSADPVWLTEGIADYLRWAVYEGKPQSYFPRPREKQGYKRSYQVTAGFLLWLETEKAPGIVNKLNTAMRNRKYSEEMFKDATGETLDELWDAYAQPRPRQR